MIWCIFHVLLELRIANQLLNTFDRILVPQFYHLCFGSTTFIDNVSHHFKDFTSPFWPWWQSVDLLEERLGIVERCALGILNLGHFNKSHSQHLMVYWPLSIPEGHLCLNELFPTSGSSTQNPNLPHLWTSPILILPCRLDCYAEIPTWWVLCVTFTLLDEGSPPSIEVWMMVHSDYHLHHDNIPLCALLGEQVHWLVVVHFHCHLHHGAIPLCDLGQQDWLVALGKWVYQHFSPCSSCSLWVNIHLFPLSVHRHCRSLWSGCANEDIWYPALCATSCHIFLLA